MPMLLEPITPVPSASLLSFGDIEGIERDFCSNFSCCDQLFPDLHSLMDHRDTHGLVYATDSLNAYIPSPVAGSASPSPSSPSSPTMPLTPLDAFLQWPTTDNMDVCQQEMPAIPSPPTAQDWPTSSVGFGLLEDLEIGAVPIYEQCFHTAVSSVSSSPSPTSVASSSSSNWVASIPTSLPSLSLPPSPIPEPRRVRSLEFPSALKVKKSKSTISLKDDILQKKPSGRKSEGRGCGRKRERRYVCPTPGCMKQYLNPNGLKYHQEKGTCQFESSAVEGSSSSPEPDVESPGRSSKPSSHPTRSSSSAQPTELIPPATYEPIPDVPPSLATFGSAHPPVAVPPAAPATVPYRYPQLEALPMQAPQERPPYYRLPPFSNTSSSLSMWNGGLPL